MPLAGLSGKKKLGPSTARLIKVDQGPSNKQTKTAPKRHPWMVVHACELAREVLPLVEGQLAAGMRPFLLTPGGYGAAGTFLDTSNGDTAAQISLLETWSHVREWRKLLNESAAETASEIIHAHSF